MDNAMQRSRMLRILLRSMVVAIVLVAGLSAWALSPVLHNYWTVRQLLTKLESPNESDRANAARSLAKLGPPAARAVPSLLSRLRDDVDRDVRGAAAGAVAELGNADQVAPALIERLALSNPTDVTESDVPSNLNFWQEWEIME